MIFLYDELSYKKELNDAKVQLKYGIEKINEDYRRKSQEKK